MLFTACFYHFLFWRYLNSSMTSFSSEILLPFPNSNHLNSCELAKCTIKWGNFGRFFNIFLYIFSILYNKRFLFGMYNNDSPCSAIYFEFLPLCSSIELNTIQVYVQSCPTLLKVGQFWTFVFFTAI